MNERLNQYSPYALSVLRIIAGLLFFAHGSAKLLGFPATGMNPPISSLPGIAGIIELITGVLIVLGLFTRPAVFLASGLAAAAYFMAHAPQNFHPIINGGELAIMFCFAFFYLLFAGPGPWSVDAARNKA